jgi:hypothetical protein
VPNGAREAARQAAGARASASEARRRAHPAALPRCSPPQGGRRRHGHHHRAHRPRVAAAQERGRLAQAHPGAAAGGRGRRGRGCKPPRVGRPAAGRRGHSGQQAASLPQYCWLRGRRLQPPRHTPRLLAPAPCHTPHTTHHTPHTTHHTPHTTHHTPHLPYPALQAEEAEAELDGHDLKKAGNVTRSAKAVNKGAEVQEADSKSPTAVRARRRSF